MGNEACVEGAIAAGMRFFAGYPITPSTEVAEYASEMLPKYGGKFIQMEDEIAGMAACIGGAIAGEKSMTATSGPGFSLKMENIGYAAMAEIPCVIINVMRSGPSTGLPTSPSQADVMQARWGSHGDYPMIALAPSSVKEAYNVTIRAFNLSEKYRTPVCGLMDETIGHLREGVDLPKKAEVEIINRKKPTCKPEDFKAYEVPEGEIVPLMPAFGDGYKFNITGLVHDETGFPTNSTAVAGKLNTRLKKKIDDNVNDIIEYEITDAENCDVLVLTYGGTARAVIAARKSAPDAGIRMGMFRCISIWPFPEEALLSCIRENNIKHVLVAELNYGQISLEVERIVKNEAKVHHIGKVDGDILYPNEILKKVSEVIKHG
jgi:2-oxoglutarate ferredoxin oxidoreductase subunit alpha